MIPRWAEILLALLVFLGISGGIGPWLSRRYRKGAEADERERLVKDFATKEDFNLFRQSLEGRMDKCVEHSRQAQEAGKLALHNADEALSAAALIRKDQEHFRDRMANEYIAPLREMEKTVRLMGENVAATTALVKRLTEEWDQHRKESRP